MTNKYLYYYCCENNRFDALKKIDMTLLSDWGIFEGFRLACMKGNFRIVRYLVDNPRLNIHEDCEYAYRWAWLEGHKNVSKYLINRGCFFPADKLYINDLIGL